MEPSEGKKRKKVVSGVMGEAMKSSAPPSPESLVVMAPKSPIPLRLSQHKFSEPFLQK